ncbi:MAG: FAD-dependent oxidoreductase [Rectinemataceae bacterium]|nr:FAD-dependent oxidoreductase [Rectinemataceae bacterium]
MKANVVTVNECGPDVYWITMEPERSVPKYKPGQFLHLTVDEFDPSDGYWPESRVFSIASAWDPRKVEIVYSVKGRYTALMKEKIAPGSTVWLKLPYGNFVVDSGSGGVQDIVLIAGGTGVSPFLPLLGNLHGGLTRDGHIRLHYGARENRMLIGLKLIGDLTARGLLSCTVSVEDEEPEQSVSGIRYETGRLNMEKIFEMSRDLENPAFYLSGPPAMIRSFRDSLLARGVGSDRIRIDEWE